MPSRIMIADDDDRINEMLQDTFLMEGYEVVSVGNGEEVLQVLESGEKIDLILLDVMMPVLSGWDILRYIKDHYAVKVIVLTALDSEVHELRGFKEGADDYVTKPFSRAVLLARVHRLLQEKITLESQNLIFQDLVVSKTNHQAVLRGEMLEMTAKEFQLLVLFLENNNITLSRDQLIEKVWGMDYECESRTVDTHIKMLRQTLGDYGSYIRTVRGVGYCLDGEVVRE